MAKTQYTVFRLTEVTNAAEPEGDEQNVVFKAWVEVGEVEVNSGQDKAAVQHFAEANNVGGEYAAVPSRHFHRLPPVTMEDPRPRARFAG